MSEFEIIELQNGIRCIHRRVQRPVAHLSLTIGAGTRDEQSEQHGVAHLVEHLLFKGTVNHRAYYINSALDSVGGELNAFTTKEETVVYATCLSEYVKKGTALVADMVLNSLFLQKELDKEKEIVIDEINSYKDSPSELIFDEFEELLFGDSSLGRNILGSKKDIKKIRSEDLVAFCRENYRSDRIVFALSSSLSSAEFRRLCTKIFGGVCGASKTYETARKIERVADGFSVVRRKRLSQSHVVIGGIAPSLYDGDRLAVSLLINIIGGPSALSRLNLILREKYAITYSTEGAYCPFTDTGLFTLYFSCDGAKLVRAEQLLMQELRWFCDNQLSDNQLKRYKKQFIGQLLIANDSAEGAMMAVAKSLLLYGRVENTDDILKRVEGITAVELQSVAKLLFAPENISKLCYSQN